MKIILKFSFIALLFIACDKDCDEVAETGPVSFMFEVVKAHTYENVFTLNLYTKNQLHITDQNGEVVDFSFINENNANIVHVILGWKTKTDVYTVKLGQNIEFQILFSLREIKSDCHTNTALESLEIQGARFEMADGPMQILVP